MRIAKRWKESKIQDVVARTNCSLTEGPIPLFRTIRGFGASEVGFAAVVGFSLNGLFLKLLSDSLPIREKRHN